MNKPVFPKPKHAAEPKAETEHLRKCARKWAGGGLHEALAQLIEARALACAEETKPAGELK